MLNRALIARSNTRPGRVDVCETHALVRVMLGEGYQRSGTCRELWAIPTPNRLLVQYPGVLDVRWLPPDCQLVGSETVRVLWPAGTLIMWSVIANPTVETSVGPYQPPPGGGTWTAYCRTHKVKYRRTKHRTPIKDDAAIVEWARTKLAGIESTTINIGRRVTVSGLKRDRRVTLWTAHLTGTGVVGDPEAWSRVLSLGIGDGRAYGCGLVVCSEIAQ